MDPDLMEHNFNRMCTDLCEGDTEQASALLLWKPFLLPQSERLAPLVRLMTEDLQATLSQGGGGVGGEGVPGRGLQPAVVDRSVSGDLRGLLIGSKVGSSLLTG